MIGCILVATVEQVMRHLQVHHVHGHGHVQPTSAESPTRERLQYEVDSEVPSSTPGDSNGSHGPRGHDHRSFSIVAVSLEDEEEGKRLEKEGHAFIKAIVMDASIAVHSVIIGIALGINTSYSSIATLTVAYVFHQGFEGIGLGVAIACSGLTRLQKALLALIFCFTTPIGIAVGAGISSTYNENAAGNLYARGILNALASGNLIYVALVEMMVDDLNDPAVKDRPLFKAGMLFAVALGAAALAIIAIWA